MERRLKVDHSVVVERDEPVTVRNSVLNPLGLKWLLHSRKRRVDPLAKDRKCQAASGAYAENSLELPRDQRLENRRNRCALETHNNRPQSPQRPNHPHYLPDESLANASLDT